MVILLTKVAVLDQERLPVGGNSLLLGRVPVKEDETVVQGHQPS